MQHKKVLVMTVGLGRNVINDTVESPTYYLFAEVPRFTQVIQAVNYHKHADAKWLAAELCGVHQEIRSMLAQISQPGLQSLGKQFQPAKCRPYATIESQGAKLWVQFSWENQFVFDEPGWQLGDDDIGDFVVK